MINKTSLLITLSLFVTTLLKSQSPSTDVFLLTCSPGTESYSMYGHSALRVVDNESGTDMVYNWGVFDFSTPNFNYKFARGKLNYMLGVYPYNRFLQEYFTEKRSVYSQKINLDENDLINLKTFLGENMKDDNRYYLYDFFMDNCATRIRDIFETILGDEMKYPVEKLADAPTYRDRLDEYKGDMLWLDAGIDLLLGSPADEKCGFRGSMFLPDYLKSNLSMAVVERDGAIYNLLGPQVTIFEFDPEEPDLSIINQPWFLLSVIALLIFLFTFTVKSKLLQGLFDQPFFIVMFVLSFLMIFTNYLTDHVSMGSNFNMIWLNPLLLLSPFVIFIKNRFNWLWSLNIALAIIFMILTIFIKQEVNPAFIPVIIIIIIRSYYRLEIGKNL